MVHSEKTMPRIEETSVWLEKELATLQARVSDLVYVEGERKRTEDENKRIQSFISSIVDNIPHMIAVKDAKELTYVSLNKAGEELLGYSQEEVLGKTDFQIFSKQDAETFLANDQQVLRQATLEDIPQEWIATKHKGIRVLHTKKIPIFDNQGRPRYLLGISEDITEQREAEKILQANDRAIRELYEITSSQEIPFEERVQALLEMGGRRFGLSLGLFTKVEGNDHMIVRVHSQVTGICRGQVMPLCETFCQSTLEAEGPVSFEQATDSEWLSHPEYASTKWEAYLGTKVLVGDRVYGTICFADANPYPKKFSAADKDFLQLMARWVGGELERQQSEFLVQSIVQGTASATGKEFFRLLVKHLALALGAKYVWVTEYIDAASSKVRTLSYWKNSGYEENVEYALDDTPCEKVVTGKVCYLSEGALSFYPKSMLLQQLQASSYLGIPFFDSSRRVIGHIAVADDKPVVAGPRHMSILKIFSSRAGAELQRQQGEEALTRSEERYRALYDENPSMFFTVSPKGTILSVNRFGAVQLGYAEEELIGSPMQTIVYQEDISQVLFFLNQCTANPGQVSQWEFRKVRKDGSVIWVKEVARAIESPEHPPVIFIVCEDITKRKNSEDTLRTTLEEKEVLLKEIHHRVKNNLQVVSSLLYLQGKSIQDKVAAQMLQESQERIQAMTLLHEHAYEAKHLGTIGFSRYAKRLVMVLQDSYESSLANLQVTFNIEELAFDLDTAMPCGLILNELVTNALKHAFPKRWMETVDSIHSNKLAIELYQDVEEQIVICVRDNGTGFPADIDFRSTSTLGMRLVCTLTKQLQGTIHLERENGTAFIVRFKTRGKSPQTLSDDDSGDVSV